MPRPPVSPTKKAKRRERTSTVTEGSDPPKPSKAVRRSTKGKGKAIDDDLFATTVRVFFVRLEVYSPDGGFDR